MGFQGTELLSLSFPQVADLNLPYPKSSRKQPERAAHDTSFLRETSPLSSLHDVCYTVSAHVPSHGPHDAAGAGELGACIAPVLVNCVRTDQPCEEGGAGWYVEPLSTNAATKPRDVGLGWIWEQQMTDANSVDSQRTLSRSA